MKPIICLDFDGVLHSYTSGWQGVDIIPDPPVMDAMSFLTAAVERFSVQIYSSRSDRPEGRLAMMRWLLKELIDHFDGDAIAAAGVFGQIIFPDRKPPAHVTLDDRAINFSGAWPSLDDLANFKPWNWHLRHKA